MSRKLVVFVVTSLLAIALCQDKEESCSEKCGVNTECQLENLEQPCHCKSGFSGNPFDYCYPLEPKQPNEPSKFLKNKNKFFKFFTKVNVLKTYVLYSGVRVTMYISK